MDKRVMIIKLLLAVYILSECECDMLTLNQIMCPSYGKTVVFASVKHVKPSDADGNRMYIMSTEVIFKNGPNALQEPCYKTFKMKFPSEGMSCGHTFPEDINENYIIAGDVGSDGILYSSMCQYMKSVKEVYADDGNRDLLEGTRRPSCGRGDS